MSAQPLRFNLLEGRQPHAHDADLQIGLWANYF